LLHLAFGFLIGLILNCGSGRIHSRVGHS
jgi:hypothetical protein